MLKKTLVMTACLFLFLVINMKSGIPHAFNPNPVPLSWHEIIEKSPKLLLLSLGIGFIFSRIKF